MVDNIIVQVLEMYGIARRARFFIRPTNFVTLVDRYIDKQPMGCDAQLAETQIGKGKCPGRNARGIIRGNVRMECLDSSPCRSTSSAICDTLVSTHTHTQKERKREGERESV